MIFRSNDISKHLKSGALHRFLFAHYISDYKIKHEKIFLFFLAFVAILYDI